MNNIIPSYNEVEDMANKYCNKIKEKQSAEWAYVGFMKCHELIIEYAQTKNSIAGQEEGKGMTAREFFTAPESPLTLDKICTPQEQEFLLDMIELYAKGKVNQATTPISEGKPEGHIDINGEIYLHRDWVETEFVMQFVKKMLDGGRIKIVAGQEEYFKTIKGVPTDFFTPYFQPSEGKGELYRWVKAWERLPDDKKDYPLRLTGDFLYTGWYNADGREWVTDKEGSFESSHVEWLEQIPTPAPAEGKTAASKYADSIVIHDAGETNILCSELHDIIDKAFLAGLAHQQAPPRLMPRKGGGYGRSDN